jgi:hypothetical protein|tara:strand:- start:1982 stop:2149 length:168 start_codon:yes stop_codon:yes gene_type:complete
MVKKKTTHWRVPKDLAKELKYKFPDVSQADLFRVMYRTSTIRWEAGLRKKYVKKR